MRLLDFLKRFKNRKVPSCSKYTSSYKLKQSIGPKINELLELIRIKRCPLKGEQKLVLSEDDEKESGDDSSDTKEDYTAGGKNKKKQFALGGSTLVDLIPMHNQKSDLDDIRKLERLNQPIFTENMTEEEKNEIRYEKILYIQRRVKNILEQKKCHMRILAKSKPYQILVCMFKSFGRCYSKITFLYERLSKQIILKVKIMHKDNYLDYQQVITLENVLQHIDEELLKRIKHDESMDDDQGTYDRQKRDKRHKMEMKEDYTESSEFKNVVLAQIARELPNVIKIEEPSTSEDRPKTLKGILNFPDPEKIELQLQESNINVRKNEEPVQYNIISDMVLLKLVKTIQRHYRSRFYSRYRPNKGSNEATSDLYTDNRGTLRMLTQKKLGDKYFYLKVYEKKVDQETHLNFSLFPIEKNRMGKTHEHERLSYRVGDNPLMNSQGQDLISFLISRLKRRSHSSDFIGNGLYFDLPTSPNLMKVTNRAQKEDKTEYEALDKEETEDKKNAPSNETYDAIKKSVLRDVIVDDKIAITKTKLRDKFVEFNLYYDKFGAPNVRDLNNQNYLKIQIEVDKLKKTEPDLPLVMTKQELHFIVQDMAKCFQIDEDGELVVNSNKIDPSCVSIIKEEKMEFTNEEQESNEKNKRKLKELEKILVRNQTPLTVLSKTTRILGKSHYLMIVYRQESIIGEDAMSTLANYEQYNINYILDLKNLSNSSESKISVTFSDEECWEYFHLRDEEKIAQFFLKTLTMFDNMLILPIKKKMHLSELEAFEKKNIMFYYDKALKLIHRFMRSRNFLIAYKKYRYEVAVRKSVILHMSKKIEGIWYMAMIYMSSGGENFKVSLWNLKTFKEYKLKVSKALSKTYMKSNEIFAELLLKSLYFHSDQSNLMKLGFASEYIKNNYELEVSKQKQNVPRAGRKITLN